MGTVSLPTENPHSLERAVVVIDRLQGRIVCPQQSSRSRAGRQQASLWKGGEAGEVKPSSPDRHQHLGMDGGVP